MFEEYACATSDYPVKPVKVRLVNWGSCEGGFTGLGDMSGNVKEWEDSCTGDSDEPGENCRVRGGGYGSPKELSRCQSDDALGRGNTSGYVGIRCCADAVPQR